MATESTQALGRVIARNTECALKRLPAKRAPASAGTDRPTPNPAPAATIQLSDSAALRSNVGYMSGVDICVNKPTPINKPK